MKKVKLGEVCEIVTGSTPKSTNPDYWNGEYKWITPAEISDDDFIIVDTQRKISKLGIEKTGLKSFPMGTVLLSSRAPIGKVAIAGCEMYCNQGFKNFICSNEINNEYLYYFLKSRKNFLNNLGRGATFKELSKSIISNIEFILPSYDVQCTQTQNLKKIDNLIYLRKKVIKEYHILVKSRFNEMFGDPILNDMGWQVTKLGELTNKISSGNTPKGGSQVYVDKGIMFFRSQNVWKNKILLDDIAYIDDQTNRNMKDTILEHGDLLITKTGRVNTENSSLGRTAQYLGQSGKANINGHVYLVRINSDISKRFILEILISNAYRDYIRRICVGGIDKRQLNKNHIEDFPIILPPLSLQNEFADFVAQVDKSQFACGIVIKLWRNSLKSSII